MAIELLTAGLLTTVQDGGRFGAAALGFQESGACDKYSMKLANLLAGNLERPDRAAVLEFTAKGAAMRFSSREVVALTGACMDPQLNGAPAPMFRPLVVGPGDVLSLGVARSGLRGYLAVYGGIDVPEVMGSRSTSLKCNLGGFEGRALRAGDVLTSGAWRLGGGMEDKSGAEYFLARLGKNRKYYGIGEDEEWLRLPPNPYRLRGAERIPVLRALPGPPDDRFTREAMDAFVSGTYTLTKDCDRMACRLEGPHLQAKGGSDILSEAVVEGSVQVAADGQPMVMLADHQTTGGYAKIVTVIGTDIPALAQLGPGGKVIFRFISPREANDACRREARRFLWLKERLLALMDCEG